MGGCGGRHLRDRDAFPVGDGARGHRDGCRFVPLARVAPQNRGVGLKEERRQRQPIHELLLLPGAHHRGWDGEGETEGEAGLRGRRPAVERMEENTPRVLLIQHLDCTPAGGPRVDVQRQVELECEPDLAAKDRLLERLARRISDLPVIKADLADRDELRAMAADEGSDLALQSEVEMRGVEPGARLENREALGKGEDALRLCRRFAHAEDGADAGSLSPRQDRLAVGVEDGVGYVGVTVDKLHGYLRRLCAPLSSAAAGWPRVGPIPGDGSNLPAPLNRHHACCPEPAGLSCLVVPEQAPRARRGALSSAPARARSTMVIPLRDVNPSRTFPLVNILLIAANALAFFYELSLGPGLNRFLMQAAFIPHEYFAPGNTVADARSIVTSMFLHGGWMHLLGNMLYLWIFGDNVEDRVGHLGYLAFYLVAGWGATLAHAHLNPTSAVPAIGASGAISGVLGAYLVLFPRARVITLIPLGFYTRIAEMPALLVLGFWFVLQLLSGVVGLGARGAQGAGVAWWAHIGGFVIGMVLGWFFAALRAQRGPRGRRF